MKKRNSILLTLLFILALAVPTAFASFIIKADEGHYEVDQSGELVETDNCIILDYNDGVNGEVAYPYSSLGIKVSDLPVPTENLSNHTFEGWYSTKTGTDETGASTKLTGTFAAKVGQRIYARYTNDAGILSTLSSQFTINKYSPESGNVYYFGASDGSGEMYINNGGYVQVYYGSNSVWNQDTSGTDYSVKFLNEADVIVKLDCDIVINGGYFQINSVFGYEGAGLANGISGSFTALDLNGYTITVRNDGYLNGYGIIYNSQDTGGIAIEDGYISTCFTTIDFSGGGNLTIAYIGTIMPFLGYCAPYLCCEVIVSSLGEIRGFTSMYVVSFSSKYSTNFCLINNPSSTGDAANALLTLENGYIIKNTTSYDRLISEMMDQYNYNEKFYNTSNVQRYLFDPDVYREEFIFTDDPNGKLKHLDVSYPKTYQCIAEFNALTMNVQGQDATMRYGTFPIPSFMDIEAYNTKLSFAIDLVIMPGANIHIDESSTVNMSVQKSQDGSFFVFSRITVMDRYPNDLQITYDKSGAATKTNIYGGLASYFVYNLLKIKDPPKVTMNGKFTFDTSLCAVNFSNTYQYWYSIGGGINLSDSALESLRENQEKVEIASRAYIPAFYTVGGSMQYDSMAGQWFNQPIIGDERSYFQPGGKGTEIVVCEDFDEENGLVKYKGDWYFYKFDKETGQTGFHDYSLFSMEPDPDSYKAKLADTSGAFTKLDEAPVTLSGTEGDAVYIKYNGVYRINIIGAFIELTGQPSLNSYGGINHVTTASATSTKLNDTTGSADFTLSTDASFEPSTQHWRLAYAS